MPHSSRVLARLAVAALAALPAAALAHDFFLLPPADGTQAGIVATVGSIFPTPEIAITPDRVTTARGDTAAGPVDVRLGAVSGNALSVNLSGAARPAIVSLTLKPRDVEYRDDRIDLILDEYPVGISAKAAVAGLPQPRLLKVDSRRFAKTAVCAGRCTALHDIEAHGLELEFIAVADGRFRLIENQIPVGGHEVVIATVDGKRQHVTTDARGEVSLPADVKGRIMLFASRMIPPTAPEGRFVLRLSSFTLDAG